MAVAFGTIFVVLSSLAALCDSNHPSYLDTLNYAIIIHRHGDRTPVTSYAKDPYKNCKWYGGMGSLTQKGAGRLFELGTTLRKRYFKLLPESGFYTADILRVDSSPEERCLMSTQCILSALLPPPAVRNGLPLRWQPVAVNVIASDSIIFFPIFNCPKYTAIMEKLDNYPDPETAVYKYYLDNAQLFAFLVAHTGENSTLTRMAAVHDALFSEQDNGLRLPDWVQRVGLDTLLKVRERAVAATVETPYLTRIAGAPLATHLVDKLTQKANGTISQNLQIFSLHDNNIIQLMAALNMVDEIGFFVDFGVTLVFELHQINGCPVVEILLYEHPEDKTPRRLPIPSCPHPCTLNEFQRIVSKIAISTDEFRKICTTG